MNIPLTGIFAAHKEDGRILGQPFQVLLQLSWQVKFVGFVHQVLEPFADFLFRLFDECPHWQAINETARPIGVLGANTIPKPCQNGGGCFAKTSWNVDELRMTDRTSVTSRQAGLVAIGRTTTRSGSKKGIE
jgi:hypothetical protein